MGEGRESAIAIGEDVAFGGGDADMSDFRGIVAGVSEVDGPEDVHLGSHDGIRMVIAIGQNDGLFLRGELRSKPSGGHGETPFPETIHLSVV